MELLFVAAVIAVAGLVGLKMVLDYLREGRPKALETSPTGDVELRKKVDELAAQMEQLQLEKLGRRR